MDDKEIEMECSYSDVKRVLVEDYEQELGLRQITIETESGDHIIWLHSEKRIPIQRRRRNGT